MLYDYLKEQERSLGEDAVPVMLLGVTAAIYPLLGEFGIYLDAPLAVIVEEESWITEVAKVVLGFAECEVMSLAEKPKKVCKKIEKDEYGITVFRLIDGRHTKDNLETVRSDCAGIRGNISERRLAIVLVQETLSCEYRDDFSGYVYIKGKLPYKNISQEKWRDFLKELIKMILQNANKIRYEIRNLPPVEEDGLRVFYAAYAVILMLLKYENMENGEYKRYTEMLLKNIREIAERWKEIDDPQEYAGEFIRLLDDVADRLFPMEERWHISGEAEKRREKTILYDEKYYYIPHSLFEEICRPITDRRRINYVKRQLCEAGILDSTDVSRMYGTLQVETTNVYGAKIRRRYVRLFRNRVDREVELSFLQKVNAGEEIK